MALETREPLDLPVRASCVAAAFLRLSYIRLGTPGSAGAPGATLAPGAKGLKGAAGAAGTNGGNGATGDKVTLRAFVMSPTFTS